MQSLFSKAQFLEKAKWKDTNLDPNKPVMDKWKHMILTFYWLKFIKFTVRNVDYIKVFNVFSHEDINEC